MEQWFQNYPIGKDYLFVARRVFLFIYRWLFAAAGAVYLLTIGLREARHREFLYKIPTYFGYHPTKPIIPSIPQTEIIRPDTILTLYDPVQNSGEVTLLELVCISALISDTQPQRLLEIGTLGGRTTLNMVANTHPLAEIYTLDLPNTDHHRAESTKELLGRQWTQLYGDSLTFDFSQLYNSLDFVFIDANHQYEYVRSDSLQAMKMLRNGSGVIIWHDYTSWDWEGNTRALNDLYASEDAFGDLRHIEGTSLVFLRRSRIG